MDEDALLNTQCPANLELRWQTEVSSSVYATPLISDINSDGKLEIVVPSFVHYLEGLEGSDRDKLPGWPAYHMSTVHASPLLYDIDKDGAREIALAVYNGEVIFFRVSGYMMVDRLVVPRRKIRKNWFGGLRSDPVDRTHPEVHDDLLVMEATNMNSVPHEGITKVNKSTSVATESHTGINTSVSNGTVHGLNTSVPITNEINLSMVNTSNPEVEKKVYLSQLEADIKLPTSTDNSYVQNVSGEIRTSSGRRLLEDNKSSKSEEGSSESEHNNQEDIPVATVENDGVLEEDAESSFELLRDHDELAYEYNYDYDDYVDEKLWGDEEWTEEQHEILEDYVNVDAHILCTPVIADIDNDGVTEMVVAVSYFFDKE